MAARFGDMLLEQRRRMGLSIQQVANTIKIRPQIIEFFENGNFASMPPRGYAQGMISSYARFLGLNPREVVNAYFDDLMAYERETSQQGGRFQDAAGYVNSRSSVDNGRFLMVQGGRSTRYGQRPQQAGYVTETGSGEEIRSQRDRFRSTPTPDDRALPAARGLSRDPRAGYGDGGYSQRPYRAANARSRGGYADADTTQVTPRLRSQSQPYGQRGPAPRSGQPRSGQRNYQGRGGLEPRSGQRGGQRSGNYRGRADSGRGRAPQNNLRPGSGRGRGTSRAPQNNGLDPRIVYAGIGVVALLLIVLIVVLLRGCGSSAPESTPDTPVATKTTTKKSSKKTETTDEDESTDEDTDESTDATKTSAKKTEDEPTKVKVSVAKGKTAWIEVKVDGKSVYGAQATGPFEQEYTPESSIEITTSKPSDVTVTKNGEKVRYDTKTSGVARVTITVPKKETTDTEDGEDADGTDSTDGSDAQSTDGTDAQSVDGTDGTDTATDGQTTTYPDDYSYDSY